MGDGAGTAYREIPRSPEREGSDAVPARHQPHRHAAFECRAGRRNKMKLTFKTGSIDSAPNGYARVRLTDEPRGTKRFVRENGIEWLEIGAGKGSEMTRRKFITLCRAIVQTAKQNKLRKIAVQFDRTPEIFSGMQKEITSGEEVSELAAANFEMANFEFTQFKTKPKTGFPEVDEILLYGKSSKSIEAAARKGQLIGEEVNKCRILANTP